MTHYCRLSAIGKNIVENSLVKHTQFDALTKIYDMTNGNRTPVVVEAGPSWNPGTLRIGGASGVLLPRAAAFRLLTNVDIPDYVPEVKQPKADIANKTVDEINKEIVEMMKQSADLQAKIQQKLAELQNVLENK